MLRLFTLCAWIALAALSGGGSAMADDTVSVGAKHLFVPDGFDNNDQVQVVVDGVLPDTCHQLTKPVVFADPATHGVTIDLRSYVNEGSCIPVPVPFELTVDLGTLAAADWTVTVVNPGVSAPLSIKSSTTSGPDDYLYAPVALVSVAFDADAGRYVAILKGDLFSDCVEWSETKILNQGAVVVLLPILQQTNADCQAVRRAFRETVVLPADLAPGKHLIHVRSLSGQAVNYIFSVNP